MTPFDAIVYHIVTPLPPDAGRLLLAGREDGAQMQWFTQADVDSGRLVWLSSGDGGEWRASLRVGSLMFSLVFRAARQPQFHQQETHFTLPYGSNLNITKEVFHLDNIDNQDPNLNYIITKTTHKGALTILFNNRTIMKLDDGCEFTAEHLGLGIVQYHHYGAENDGEDWFEVLATDGTFEAISIVRMSISPWPKVQFALQAKDRVITVEEHGPPLRLPLLREDASLSFESRILCTSAAGSAIPGVDFHTVRQMVVFPAGMRSSVCEVILIDDSNYEGEETFTVKLETIPNGLALLGEVTDLRIRLVDPEDCPKVQFDTGNIIIDKNHNKQPIVINVLRDGDVNMKSLCMVKPVDGTAVSGKDYELLSKQLMFGPGVRQLSVTIILKGHHRSPKNFSVVLIPQHPTVSGRQNFITVLLNDTFDGKIRRVSMLPTIPVVMSLDNERNGSRKVVRPGLPVVCVSPCDLWHPSYNEVAALCTAASITEIAVYWEVSAASSEPFRRVLSVPVTILRDSWEKVVLDPVFFAPGFKLRCVALPVIKDNGKEETGWHMQSHPVMVGQHGPCPPVATSLPPTFLATREPINDSAHVIHLIVEVPHVDGSLPLVSTKPLDFDIQFSQMTHCSNMFPGAAFLTSQHLQHRDADNLFSIRKANNTLQIYNHLSLDNCLWTFEAWLHMSELVNDCGGKVIPESQINVDGEKRITVVIPLYVNCLFSSGSLAGLSSINHHTELEVSFDYQPVLLKRGPSTHRQLNATLQVTRVSTDSNGRLVLDFVTTAYFHGQFLKSHTAMPDSKSSVVPPPHIYSNFSLDLLWTESVHRNLLQSWRAISDYSLQDYSGEYKAKLIPCTIQENYSHSVLNCTPNSHLVTLAFPVAFQQSAKPAAVTYQLKTQFIINKNQTFSNVSGLQDYSGPFLPEDKVFGYVTWLPDHKLKFAYQLNIERVLLCSVADSAPPKSCLQGLPGDSLSILLLDRNDPSVAEHTYNDIPFEAFFISDVDKLNKLENLDGADGFVFKVAPLYNIHSANQWYLQVMYTIAPRTTLRMRRSDASFPKSGSSLRHLLLVSPAAAVDIKNNTSPVAASVITVGILMTVGSIMSIYLWRRSQRRHDSISVVVPCELKILTTSEAKPVVICNSFGTEVGTPV